MHWTWCITGWTNLWLIIVTFCWRLAVNESWVEFGKVTSGIFSCTWWKKQCPSIKKVNQSRTGQLSALNVGITWDTRTIGTYSHHHMGHTNYWHLLPQSHGTHKLSAPTISIIWDLNTPCKQNAKIFNVTAGGTHNNHWAWKGDYSHQSNKALLTSQQFPKMSLPQTVFCPPATSRRWTIYIYIRFVVMRHVELWIMTPCKLVCGCSTFRKNILLPSTRCHSPALPDNKQNRFLHYFDNQAQKMATRNGLWVL